MCNDSQIDSDWLANVIRGSVAPGTTRSSLLNRQAELVKAGERMIFSLLIQKYRQSWMQAVT